MKKIIALLIAAIMVFSLAACGTKAPAAEEKPAAAEEAASAAEETAAASEYKLAVILQGSLGDESINDQANAGLQLCMADFGIEGKYVEAMDATEYVDIVETLVEGGYNIIACDSYEFEDLLREVAPVYPDVHFMILDTEVDGLENVTSFMYATHECSFLAGVVAAMESKTGVVGFIGGMEIPTITKFQVGFEEGVASVNPDAKVIVKYIGNDNSVWNDPATAKSLTLDCIANGADVCYHAAGASGLGMIEACHENDIWAIGVNIDENHCDPCHVLTSALTLGDRAIYLFTQSILNGEPLTGLNILDCENGGVDVVRTLLSDEVNKAVDEAKAGIIDGSLVVTNIME